jgi:hypothetical protein
MMTSVQTNSIMYVTEEYEYVGHNPGFVPVREMRTRKVWVNADWKSLIIEEMTKVNDSWDNVVSCTLTEEELCEQFDEGFGGREGKSFTVWTKTRVYFPAIYDGREWVESVSRNPDGNPTHHVGGD